MMELNEIVKTVETNISGAKVRVKDLMGGSDHFQVEVASEAFRGKSLIEQHQIVQAPFAEAINEGRIHALSIKTHLPENWREDPSDTVRLE